jgi:hypothetical protein
MNKEPSLVNALLQHEAERRSTDQIMQLRRSQSATENQKRIQLPGFVGLVQITGLVNIFKKAKLYYVRKFVIVVMVLSSCIMIVKQLIKFW